MFANMAAALVKHEQIKRFPRRRSFGRSSRSW